LKPGEEEGFGSRLRPRGSPEENGRGQGAAPAPQPVMQEQPMLDPTQGRFLQRDEYPPPLKPDRQSDFSGKERSINLYNYAGGNPSNAADPTGLAWTAKQLVDSLMKCGHEFYFRSLPSIFDPDFANIIVEIAPGTPTEGFGADVDLSTGKITIQKDQDVCEAIQSLIVELSNLSHRRDFKELNAACKEGMKSREEYIKETEKLEFLGVRQVITLFDECGEKWGCNSCYYEGVRGKDFEEFYSEYTSAEATRHKEYYGKWWDRNCKEEWTLQHTPQYYNIPPWWNKK
jgi:RHS repeat-associated protein